MKNKYFKQLQKVIIVIFLFPHIQIQGQSFIGAGGGEFTGNNGTFSYTIGQTSYNYVSSINNESATEGIQQSYNITISNISETSEVDTDITAYPNPTIDKFFISINNPEKTNEIYSLYLYDEKGYLLNTFKTNGKETPIDMCSTKNGIYFLKIVDKIGKTIKTFKIIKI